MLIPGLQRSFERSMCLVDAFSVLPIEFDRSKNLLKLSNSRLKRGTATFQRTVVYLYTCYISAQLVIVFSKDSSDYYTTVSLLLTWCVLMICSGAQRNFNNKPSDWVWLYNQVQQLNDKFCYKITKGPIKEKIMTTWFHGHCILAVLLVMKFFTERTHPRYIYSVLPEYLQGGAIFAFFVLIELITISSSVNTNETEFYTQAWIIKSLITWHQLIVKVPKTECELREKVHLYNMIRIMTTQFTICFGVYIEVIKTVMQIGCIYYVYAFVLNHNKMGPVILGQIATSIPFTISVPPFLYGNCYQVYDGALLINRNYTLALNNVSLNEKRSSERIVRAMRPNRVVLNGLYFLDRMMSPMFFSIIFNTTISLLLMARNH